MLKPGYIVLNTRTGKDGSTIHELKDLPDEAYAGIRGGVSWPNHLAPGYYCIFGEAYNRHYDYRHRETRRPLRFLAEGEAETLERLFDSMTDDAAVLGCKTFYVDLDREDHADFFRSCMDGGRFHVSLAMAPFAGDFQVGVGLIEGWRHTGAFRDAGLPPESILSDQLRKITKEDLVGSPEINFYAVNAFRYLVGGFEKNPWRPSSGLGRLRPRHARVL
jgi:hypothetical protein